MFDSVKMIVLYVKIAGAKKMKVRLSDPLLEEDKVLKDDELAHLLAKLCLSDSIIRRIRALIKSETPRGLHTKSFRAWLDDLTEEHLNSILTPKDKLSKTPQPKAGDATADAVMTAASDGTSVRTEAPRDADDYDSSSVEWSDSAGSSSDEST